MEKSSGGFYGHSNALVGNVLQLNLVRGPSTIDI